MTDSSSDDRRGARRPIVITMDGTGHFLGIDADECWRLLGDASVGRVCWLSSRGIMALPVNFKRWESRIVFRVSHGSLLSELTQPSAVAFEVDDIDPTTATGWSVLVQGISGPWHGEDPIASDLPTPWAPGERTVLVSIVPSALTGRAVSAN